MSSHNELGKTGELLALKYLEEKGFTIIEHNWRFGRFEIDIIASLKDTIHFVEVKTRSSKTFGLPEESVSVDKVKRLSIAANAYLQFHKGWKWIQHDILSITIVTGHDPEFHFMQDVWVGAGNIRL
jgi:putative endonuclease